MNKYLRLSLSILIMLAIFSTTLWTSPATAAGTIEVNSDADTAADDGFCTLREAITAANTDFASGATAGECAAGSTVDTITFAANYTITLTGQLPAIFEEMTINGNGAANTIVQANVAPDTATYRVFEVKPAGNLTLDGLTVRYGYCDLSCTPFSNLGGGIYNAGTLLVSNSILEKNASGTGGAIYNLGGLTVTDTVIADNQASYGGSIFNNSGTVSISNSTISRVTVDDSSTGNGGGMVNYNSGTLIVHNSTFKNLLAKGDRGGAIYNMDGTTTITNSTFDGNQITAGYGGGIYNSNEMEITNSTFSANEASSGGGIYNNGTATILNSTFYGNIASTNGNGLFNNYTTLHLKNSILYHDHAVDSKQDCYNASGNTISSEMGNILAPMGPDHRCGTVGSAATPLLDTLKDNGGFTQTHALLAGSPAIDAGDNTVCADAATVNNQDQRGVTRPFDGDGNGTAICDIGSFEVNNGKKTLRSQAKFDGWVLESGEFSGEGGTKNKLGKVLKVGDNVTDKQYRAILSFGTAGIPDGAKITRVILKVRKAGVDGTNPMKTHNSLVVDIRKNKFSTLPALQINDFQAKPGKFNVGKFPNTLYSGNWYKAVLYNGAHAYINLRGRTQLRLRFTLGDNDDLGADILKLYSGNAIQANRPQLIVKYYVP